MWAPQSQTWRVASWYAMHWLVFELHNVSHRISFVLIIQTWQPISILAVCWRCWWRWSSGKTSLVSLVTREVHPVKGGPVTTTLKIRSWPPPHKGIWKGSCATPMLVKFKAQLYLKEAGWLVTLNIVSLFRSIYFRSWVTDDSNLFLNKRCISCVLQLCWLVTKQVDQHAGWLRQRWSEWPLVRLRVVRKQAVKKVQGIHCLEFG